MNTDQLIEQLTGELTPVSRRLSAAQRVTLWVAVALLCVAIGLAHFGVRRDIADAWRTDRPAAPDRPSRIDRVARGADGVPPVGAR